MKISQTVLFSLRLLLYLSVIILIFAHPGIAVSFDRIGIIQWIVLIPLSIIISFVPEHTLKIRIKRIVMAALVVVLSLIAGVSIIGMLQFLAAALIGYGFTSMLFRRRTMFEKYATLTSLEPFFLAWVCLRLLSLSRSGEDIAGQSETLTQFILVWTAVVFLVHSLIIYLCIYPNSRAKIWKEGIAFASSAAIIFVLAVFVLPPDFVRNTIIDNLNSDRIPQLIPPESERGIPDRGNGRRTLPTGEGQGELRGIPEHEWPGGGSGSGERRQYMVKIVASEIEPVYMGDHFRGRLDAVHGFQVSEQDYLNELAKQRIFVTWKGNEFERDFGRSRQEVFSLSTLQQKYLPYRPVVIDPTILNENSGPLRFVHQVVSNMHDGDPLMLVHNRTRSLSRNEINALSHYLELPLDDDDKQVFETYLNNALRNWRNNRERIIRGDDYLKWIFSNEPKNDEEQTEQAEQVRNDHLETIIALLASFSEYQYNINPNDDYSIAALKKFLADSKDGDCVEFSNTLALLGRFAGIPSRVVTGYLAAEGLQTPAHIRGLAALRRNIPVLQQFPFNNLYMVTNIHSHSWTQFYIPDYGWLDFESTAFSIPPEGMGDFNNWDVIIPIMETNRTISQVRKFPWRAAGRALLALLVAAIAGAYTLRYMREIILYIDANNGSNFRSRARSLYLLMLARLAADGQPIKPASKTAHEYSELFRNFTTNHHEQSRISEESNLNKHFRSFSDLYSEIRWREFKDENELNERFEMLKVEYKNILKVTKRKGIHRWFIRIINLRGLAYL